MIEAVASVEMFKVIKGRDNISVEQFFNRIDSDEIRDHSLKVRKRRVKMVIMQASFTQKAVIAWNGLPGKVVAAETVDTFILEFDRHLEGLETEENRNIDRTWK